MIQIPKKFFQVTYVAARILGVNNTPDFNAGANDQLFAYDILVILSQVFRSSEVACVEAQNTGIKIL